MFKKYPEQSPTTFPHDIYLFHKLGQLSCRMSPLVCLLFLVVPATYPPVTHDSNSRAGLGSASVCFVLHHSRSACPAFTDAKIHYFFQWVIAWYLICNFPIKFSSNHLTHDDVRLSQTFHEGLQNDDLKIIIFTHSLTWYFLKTEMFPYQLKQFGYPENRINVESVYFICQFLG